MRFTKIPRCFKKYLLMLLIAFGVIPWTSPAIAEAPELIKLQADVWCPFNCTANSKKQGYMIDVARAAFASIKIELDYRTTSWPDAINKAREGSISGIVGASHSDAPDFIFTDPLGIMKNCFFTLPSSRWTFSSIASLKPIKIGVTKGYSYNEALDSYIAQQLGSGRSGKKEKPGDSVQVGTGDQVLPQNIEKLKNGSIDAFVEEQSVVKNFLYKNILPEDSLRNAGCIKGDSVGIAFSPREPRAEEFVKLINETLQAMRKDGRFKKILAAYGLKDWVP